MASESRLSSAPYFGFTICSAHMTLNLQFISPVLPPPLYFPTSLTTLAECGRLGSWRSQAAAAGQAKLGQNPSLNPSRWVK